MTATACKGDDIVSDNNWRPGDQYRAHSFEMTYCDDPDCGLHLIGRNEDNKPMCEIVMSPAQTLAMMEFCTTILYEKATRKS
jgi:hypothetical protein